MISKASAGQAASGEGERHHCQGSGRDTKIKTIERAYGTTLLVKSTACTYMGNTVLWFLTIVYLWTMNMPNLWLVFVESQSFLCFLQCCRSGMIFSDADPNLTLQLVPDLDPVSDPTWIFFLYSEQKFYLCISILYMCKVAYYDEIQYKFFLGIFSW